MVVCMSLSMPTRSVAHVAAPAICVREAEAGDIDALVKLEHRVFATDRLSRRSLLRFLRSPTAEILVAHHHEQLAGVAIALFRSRSAVARLYSIAVAPHAAGRGVASMLLEAAEAAALARGCPHHAARSASDQSRRDLALSQERLSPIRQASRLLRGRWRCASVREAPYSRRGRVAQRAAIFSPDNRFHLWPGLYHDGARLGGSELQAATGSLSLHYGAKPRPSSPALDLAAANPTAWRSRCGGTACGRRSM